MRKVYPYRTTQDKLTQAYATVESAGHEVEHCVYVGGRDWVLIVRSDERPEHVPTEQQRQAGATFSRAQSGKAYRWGGGGRG